MCSKSHIAIHQWPVQRSTSDRPFMSITCLWSSGRDDSEGSHNAQSAPATTAPSGRAGRSCGEACADHRRGHRRRHDHAKIQRSHGHMKKRLTLTLPVAVQWTRLQYEPRSKAAIDSQAGSRWEKWTVGGENHHPVYSLESSFKKPFVVFLLLLRSLSLALALPRMVECEEGSLVHVCTAVAS